ncbi:MAG: type VI secretion system accessory protein TagJ [Bryobacteraceae bacterium]
MSPKELFQAGKLAEAIQALAQEVRNSPTDARRRTFLFELLCFAGEWDRAEKHLDVLAQAGKDAELGALMYRAALHGERTRAELFEKAQYPLEAAPAVTGTLNGSAFESIEDSDPRIGARLEIFAAGRYLWLPFAHIASIEMQAPKRLRDLLWAPAIVRTGPSFKGRELGEVLVPVLAPLTFRNADDAVRLGRTTVWEDGIPCGQKMFDVDGEEFPILEIRNLEFAAPAESHAAAE